MWWPCTWRRATPRATVNYTPHDGGASWPAVRICLAEGSSNCSTRPTATCWHSRFAVPGIVTKPRMSSRRSSSWRGAVVETCQPAMMLACGSSGSRGWLVGAITARMAGWRGCCPGSHHNPRCRQTRGRVPLGIRQCEAFRSLSPADRNVLAWQLWEGLSAREIATVLDVSEAAVWRRLERARTRLRQHLADRNHPLATDRVRGHPKVAPDPVLGPGDSASAAGSQSIHTPEGEHA